MALKDNHVSGVLTALLEGAYFKDTESARHYDKNWHTTFGVGLLERGAQRSASGRGRVDAYVGDLITTRFLQTLPHARLDNTGIGRYGFYAAAELRKQFDDRGAIHRPVVGRVAGCSCVPTGADSRWHID